MFGLGMSEMILLSVMALIIIGPKQLPEVARTLGRFINDLKRSTSDLKDEIKKQAIGDLEIKDFLKRQEEMSPPAVTIYPEDQVSSSEGEQLSLEDIVVETKKDEGHGS